MVRVVQAHETKRRASHAVLSSLTRAPSAALAVGMRKGAALPLPDSHASQGEQRMGPLMYHLACSARLHSLICCCLRVLPWVDAGG